MNSGGWGKGCCQCGSMGTIESLYMLEWMGRCESSMERTTRKEAFICSACVLCLIFSQCTLQDNDSFFHRDLVNAERIEVMADFNAFLVEGLLLLLSKKIFPLR